MAVYYCIKLLEAAKVHQAYQRDVEHRNHHLFGTFELLEWMSTATNYTPNPYALRQYVRKAHDFELLQILSERKNAVDEMFTTTPKVCRRRLWTLVLSCKRGFLAFPAILAMVKEIHLTDQRSHEDCTPEVCQFDDSNSTVVSQLHKCNPHENANDKDDDITLFPEKLNQSDKNCNTWNESGDLIHEKFMAVSYVWLDGTGCGMKAPGTVNKCLFEFFINIARDKGCNRIWWDAICIPSNRDKKAAVLSRMHENYRAAEFTLVHDQQLVNFEWKKTAAHALLWRSRHDSLAIGPLRNFERQTRSKLFSRIQIARASMLSRTLTKTFWPAKRTPSRIQLTG
jgi:hypothetical protein